MVTYKAKGRGAGCASAGSPACSRTARSSVRWSTRRTCSSASVWIRSSCMPRPWTYRQPIVTGGPSRASRPITCRSRPARHRRPAGLQLDGEPAAGRRPGSRRGTPRAWSRNGTRLCPRSGGLTAQRVVEIAADAGRGPSAGDRRRRRPHVSGDDAVAGGRAERHADLERSVDDGLRAPGGDRRGAGDVRARLARFTITTGRWSR